MSIIFMSQSATRCNQVYDNASHTFTDADIAANLTKFTDPLGQVVQVVTLRGTTRDARDWYLDFSAFPPRLDFETGWVPPGFDDGAELILPAIYRALDLDLPVLLEGHSLGGALACQLAAKLSARGMKIYGVITFGAPRAGGRKMRRLLAGYPIVQVRRGNDPVPDLPWLPLVYYHQRKLLEVGRADWLDPFTCHHMSGYYMDIWHWEMSTPLRAGDPTLGEFCAALYS